MSADDPGLAAAVKRIRQAYDVHATGDCIDGPTLDDAPEAWEEHIFAEAARAARSDVPDLIRQAKADALEESDARWRALVGGKVRSEGTDEKGRTLYRHEEVIDSIRADVRAKAARVQNA